MREIPIFPLPIVLFPGMVQPLHIFEDRYKQMIADIGETGCFGIVWADDGDDAGRVQTTGTLARISRLDPLPDGRCNLICQGVERFEILAWRPGRPYAQAEIRPLGEPDGDTRLHAAIAATFDRYLGLAFSLLDRPIPPFAPPASAAELAYLAAAAMQVDLGEKQRLLMAPTTEARLSLLQSLLAREITRLEALTAMARWQGVRGGPGISPN